METFKPRCGAVWAPAWACESPQTASLWQDGFLVFAQSIFRAVWGPGQECPTVPNGWHASASVPGPDHVPPPFPRSKACLSTVASQDQLIPGSGTDQTPAFKLLGAANTRFALEEILRCRKREVCSCDKRSR